MKRLAIAAMVILAMTACSKSNTNTTDATPAEAPAAETCTACPIAGEWAVTAIAVAGGDTIAPDAATTRIVFLSDSSFHVSTNCNSIEGNWVAGPDSITVNPMLRTEMACDDMTAEETILAVLPAIVTYTAADSTLTLTAADPATFVTLTKVPDNQ